MPIYEYHCTSCSKEHEIIQKVNDPPLTICPACGGPLKKEISLSGFQLKGGGWYKEGYSSSKPADKPADKSVEKKEAVKPAETPKTGGETASKGTDKVAKIESKK